jgi:hypothetical protein
MRKPHSSNLSPEPSLFPCLLLVALLTAACGGDSGGSPTAPPVPTSPIAGNYDVAVALSQTSCGAVPVQPQPTSIQHTAGAARFTLVHGANTFAATLFADSTFTADALAVRPGDGSTHTVVISGRFNGTAFDATVQVEVRGRPQSPADCAYTVQWNGRRAS